MADGRKFVAPVALSLSRLARMAESADATDSNSVARKGVRVQVPLRAPVIDPTMSDAQPVVDPEVEFHPVIQLELEQPQISLYKTDVFL